MKEPCSARAFVHNLFKQRIHERVNMSGLILEDLTRDSLASCFVKQMLEDGRASFNKDLLERLKKEGTKQPIRASRGGRISKKNRLKVLEMLLFYDRIYLLGERYQNLVDFSKLRKEGIEVYHISTDSIVLKRDDFGSYFQGDHIFEPLSDFGREALYEYGSLVRARAIEKERAIGNDSAAEALSKPEAYFYLLALTGDPNRNGYAEVNLRFQKNPESLFKGDHVAAMRYVDALLYVSKLAAVSQENNAVLLTTRQGNEMLADIPVEVTPLPRDLHKAYEIWLREVELVPRVVSTDDVLRLRNHRAITQFREAISMWADLIRKGDIKVEEQLRREIRARSSEMRKLSSVRSITRWTTILTLPVAIGELLCQALGPSTLITALGAAVEISHMLYERRHKWLFFGR